MPKSTFSHYKFHGQVYICPLCDYTVKNNKKGITLHMKYSHNMPNAKSESVPNINICYCGVKNCKRH